MTERPPGWEQSLLYANDLARLYVRVRQDEARLARLEGRLRDLARTSLSLVEAASLEAAGERLARELARVLAADGAAVYVARGGRHRLVARHGVPEAAASLPRDVAIPATARVEDWPRLGLGPRVLAIPFPGRAGKLAGVALAPAPASDAGAEVEHLARFAGVLLECHLLEEARLDARRPREAREEATEALAGGSAAMEAVRQLVRRVGPTPSPVLVLGETGTGKELVARAVHEASPRKSGPFVAVNCGALPENLVESEVFGHEAGAFTGAQKRHRGKVEQAHGGTLFLDELGEMPKAAQVKLLRFLQDSRFVPLGAEQERAADVRVVAATNRDIATAVREGLLREDLVFRLNVFTVELPPLRSRGRDVVELARRFAAEVAARAGRAEPRLLPEAEEALLAYRWPGNVRELRNVIERAVILGDGAIDASALPAATRPARGEAPPPEARATVEPPRDVPGDLVVADGAVNLRPFAEAKDDFLARFERAYCEALLQRCDGNVARAARVARMDKKNLHRKIRTLGIDPRRYKRQ